MTENMFLDSLPSPEPESTYTTNNGVISTAEQREDEDELYGIVATSYGRGGADLLDDRAVPWEQYTDLDDEERELVNANMHLVVKPPVEWEQNVMKHVHAFARQDRWLAGWLDEGAADVPDVEWEIEPYWSDEENARYPKNIDDFYEKCDNLDDKLSYERINSGDVYLSNGKAEVYTQRSHHGRENVTRLHLGPMHATKIDPEEISILPFETALEMDDREMWELEEEEEDVWVQAEPDHTESFIDGMETIYSVYARPDSLTTRLQMMQQDYDRNIYTHDTDNPSRTDELEMKLTKFKDKAIANGLEAAAKTAREFDL